MKMWRRIVIIENRIIGHPDTESLVEGSCRQCGECCVCWYYDMPDQPAVIPPRKGWCPHLDMETRLCLIYDERPQGCRDFPQPSDFEEGKVLPGCGFKLTRLIDGDEKCQSRR
jgi:uncharacterized cysteine cluster protein YcgN (CxxCxxCC family)